LPLVGEKLVMVKPPLPVTMKLALLVPVPAGVVREMGPVVSVREPSGTPAF
jgi:hypothetical protein